MEWDVFISHAAEDKEAVARPLASELDRLGLNVWFDEFTLRVGDPLLKSIDRGLDSSRFGVVILSHAFFSKNWPQRELEGLMARQVREGRTVTLPIWHQVTEHDVARYSQSLADVVALSTDRLEIPALADQLLAVIAGDDRDVLVGDGSHVPDLRQDTSKPSGRSLMAELIKATRRTNELKLVLAELEASINRALRTGSVDDTTALMRTLAFVMRDLQGTWDAGSETQKTEASDPYQAVLHDWQRMQDVWRREQRVLKIEGEDGRRAPAGRCHEAAGVLIESADALDRALASAIEAILPEM